MLVKQLQQAIELAGLSRVFAGLRLDHFLDILEDLALDDILMNGSGARFLESLLRPFIIPATWQKLVDLGWQDREIDGLVAGNVLIEVSTRLHQAIQAGALAVDEIDEFAQFPDQEVVIFYYTLKVKRVLDFLHHQLWLPQLSPAAFV